MRRWGINARWGAMAMLVVLVPAGVSAQTLYRCSNGASTYLSDRPCPAVSGARLGAIGPQPQRYAAPATTYLPPLGKAPDHLAYLSPACASLNDAIRTGPARGLKSAAMNDLHTEYREKCAEDETDARQQLSRERRDQRDARRTEEAALQAEQTRSTREREQCQELLRILHGKRQRRAEMSAGEQADFERFEANYHARCAAR